MVAAIKVLKYISHNGGGKPINKAKEHVKYIEANREKHRNNPELFNGKEDKLDRKEFFKRIESQSRNGVALHKFVLTMSEDERDRLQIDLKQLARDTMASFETKTGYKLDWVGGIHDDEGHPHVHIAYRGRDMNHKPVFIGPKQINELKRIAEYEKVKQVERNLGLDKARDILKEFEKEHQPDKREYYPRERDNEYIPAVNTDKGFTKTMFGVVDQLIKQSERELESVRKRAWKENEREAERLKKEKQRSVQR